jgi:hypothetical protein
MPSLDYRPLLVGGREGWVELDRVNFDKLSTSPHSTLEGLAAHAALAWLRMAANAPETGPTEAAVGVDSASAMRQERPCPRGG